MSLNKSIDHGKEQCGRCKKRGQTWDGDAPRCAFREDAFSPDNWNCATMNELRDRAADGSWLNFSARGNDSSIGIVSFDDHTRWIVMTWYKDRGRTGRAYVMCDNDVAVELTLEVAEKALDER